MAGLVKRKYRGFLDGFRASLYAAAAEASKLAGNLIIEYIQERVLTDPKSGHWYPKPGGGMYQASAANEYPAVKTGDLLESLRYTINIADAKQGRISVKVWVDPASWKSKHEDNYDKILFEQMKRLWIPTAINDLRPQIEALFKSKAIILHDYSMAQDSQDE